jgi:hypothetical protein
LTNGRKSRVKDQERGFDLNIKQVVVALGVAFGATLAVIVGKQMSTEALAVVIGVVCGVAASIPSSLLLMLAISRRDRRLHEDQLQGSRQAHYPPVVVVQGGSPQSLPPGPQAGYWPAPPSMPTMRRQFHVVGDEDLLVDG